MRDAVQIRDDEYAEIELRVLVALHDAWPGARDVRLGELYRPAGRHTGPSDAPGVIRALLAGRIKGSLSPVGLIGGRLDPATHARLTAVDERGIPWIAQARGVLAEACSPALGHASAVRDGIRA